MAKILVADDNTNIQKMVSLAFSERGVDVIAVGNGEAAVRRLPELIPDLVLADIFMPVRNGYEVCEYVKRDPRFSHIPVILLVGAFDPLDEKEAHRVGADGVLKKPFVPPDPLIAMVTSVLEKNPKLAAELAAAKKAAAAPSVQAETPTQSKPARKIPTEFPEPSPEEAALIYGFGSGRRTLDPAAVPADAQAPVSDTEAIDEFDGAATSRDWRRTAMDFEVPEEAAGRPAFAEDHVNAQAPSLTSEHAPPQAIPVTEPTEKIEPAVTVAAPEAIKEPEPARVHEVLPVPAEAESKATISLESDQTPEWARVLEPTEKIESVVKVAALETIEAPEPATVREATEVTERFNATEASAGIARTPETDEVPKFGGAAREPEPEVRETPLVEAEAGQASITSKAAGWFESIFPAKYPKGGWLSSITGSATKPESAETQAPAANSASAVHSEVEEFPTAAQPLPDAEVVPDSIEPLTSATSLEVEAMDEESFFADEPEVTNTEAVPALSVLKEVQITDSQPAVPEPVATAQSNSVEQPWSSRPHTVFAETDPALIEPPAVRVVQEPLLVNDEAQLSSTKYGGRSEQPPPLHSFLVPAVQPPDAEQPVSKAPDLNAGHEVLPAHSPIEVSERIPTAPPPSREALSEIPFLSPPPEFHQPSAVALNSDMVDAVVRKVLERLEPQLHELLSRDLLKPIVENILQNGDRKTDR